MKKILVIEDNWDMQRNLVEILELSNYKVFTAGNGKIGVEKAIEHKPDLIICDIVMPVLDGYGVLHAIQKNNDIKNTPFIFLTAKTERFDFRKSMELGADDYITKPFSTTEILTAVDSRIRKMELLKSELISAYNSFNVLNTSDKDAPRKLIDGFETNFYKKKQIIYLAGNHATRLFYIRKGKVRSFMSNNQGKELVIDLLNDGDFFGYMSLLEGAFYQDTAEAMEDTELVILPKNAVDTLLRTDVRVAGKFISMLAGKVADKEMQLIGMAYNSLRKKVAEALVFIYKKYKVTRGEFLKININRENLSTIAGTAKESLIRTLSDFKNEKLIEITDGEIFILDIERLERLIN
jgi:CheY-like chemotaxis protein